MSENQQNVPWLLDQTVGGLRTSLNRSSVTEEQVCTGSELFTSELLDSVTIELCVKLASAALAAVSETLTSVKMAAASFIRLITPLTQGL